MEAIKTVMKMPDWKKAKDKNGNSIEVRFNLPVLFGVKYMDDAVDLFNQGKFKEALRMFTNCIVEDSKNKDLYYDRALCNLRLDKPDKACKDFFKAKEFGDDNLDLIISRICNK